MTRRPILTLDITCPTCGEWPGKPCRTYEWPHPSTELPEPHIDRVKAAVTADDKRRGTAAMTDIRARAEQLLEGTTRGAWEDERTAEVWAEVVRELLDALTDRDEALDELGLRGGL